MVSQCGNNNDNWKRMKHKINNEYIDIKELPDGDSVVVFNEKNSKIVTLSNDELKVIEKYAELNNIQSCFSFFKDVYELENSEIIFDIVSKAKKMELLVPDIEDENENKLNTLELTFSGLMYWFRPFFLVKFVNIKKSRIRQFVSITLKEKISLSVAFTLIFILIAGLFFINYLVGESDSFIISYFVLFLPFVFLSTGIHELGHLVIYKLLKGIGGKIGMGLFFYVYPIMYCYDLLIISFKKWQKILLSFGGIIFDVILFIIMVIFNFDPYYIVLTVYRTLFNINPLLTKTDGFYIFKDWLGFEPLYHIKKGAWLFIQHLRKPRFKFRFFVDFLLYGTILILNVLFYLGIIFYFWLPFFF